MTEQSKLTMQESIPQNMAGAKITEGQWLSLAEAANLTGLSVITLRRYVKSKRVKARRLGKTANAKLQVYVTPNLTETPDDGVTSDELDEVLNTADAEPVDDEYDDLTEHDQIDHTNAETMSWMRKRLDESLEEIRRLNHQLNGATHRNGYLEAQMDTFREQVKLLTQRDDNLTSSNDQTPELGAKGTTNQGLLSKFGRWFLGKTTN